MTTNIAPDPPPAPSGSALLRYLTVIIGGAAVMILELLGTRIIGPFYGVSLYVWSSLIAVTLIALALGYYVGGYLADRVGMIRLPHVILAAAVSTLVIPFISGPVLTATDNLGMRAGGFTAALLLFTLPLTCLAMVGPFVIKSFTRDLAGVGTAVGSVYAISTVGSVVGTLVLGFYLLPQFGTRTILFTLTLVLLALSAWLALEDRRFKARYVSLPAAAVAIGVGVLLGRGFAHSATRSHEFKVLHEEESVYGWVRVVDDEKHGYRLLLSDSSVLSAMEIARGYTLLSYQVAMGVLPRFHRDMKDALLIGLGGGHVARELKNQGIATDTIEIDPAVADAAKAYFNFRPTGQFVVGDARYEVKRLGKAYDLIIHDCFTGGSEPTHLLTVEMLAQLRSMLNRGGILALNYVGFTEGEGSEAVASVHKTLKTLFPHIRVFVTEKSEFTDFIFLASAQPLEADDTIADRRLQWLLERERKQLPEKGGIVVTDDFNPLEHMQTRKAEAYRKIFMERIAYDLLIR
ncbi:fused MFS/spermidine synthase [Methylococcus sp. EFPC2]|uniref:fused MFS/spermidine synthase n=1 Tax=Methylococcus sp. EFPC2 TaxID=2812648 RepID=UPI001966CE79|nr:fused MFS/spermidine synthase [Methylococcus sp. EFPC2]QSA97038.1 fused MFS/spermidine synthase [Methylococcus sp. EFPC2]